LNGFKTVAERFLGANESKEMNPAHAMVKKVVVIRVAWD